MPNPRTKTSWLKNPRKYWKGNSPVGCKQWRDQRKKSPMRTSTNRWRPPSLFHPVTSADTNGQVGPPSSEGLVRGIRRWDLVAVSINGIIGAGIFGLPSKVYALIGSYSLIAFVVCALVVMLIILCFAEVGSRFEQTGGPYLYAQQAFGSAVAFEVGWLIWLARLTAFAANCNLMISYLSFFWAPANTGMIRALIIVAVVVALTFLNVVGVRQAAIASNIFTIGKLVPMLVFIAVGLFFLNPHAFALGARPATGAFSQSVLLLLYAFTGFEMATIPAGEIRNPQRDLPRALLITTALMLALTLKSSFLAALTISTIARLVAYAVTCAALPVLRKRSDTPRAHFRLRGGWIIAIAALILSVWLLLNSTRTEAIQAAAAAAGGLFIFLSFSP